MSALISPAETVVKHNKFGRVLAQARIAISR
jgi:hypothetical protein